MTASASEKSVVIAGLGLRLGSQPVDDSLVSPANETAIGRVFVTELLPGGAAERSNLLRLNDEILHVDHVDTAGRSVVRTMSIARKSLKMMIFGTQFIYLFHQNDVKCSILGIPGTSVRIGIR